MSDVGSHLQGHPVHSPSVKIMTSDDSELPLHSCSGMYIKESYIAKDRLGIIQNNNQQAIILMIKSTSNNIINNNNNALHYDSHK